MPKRASENFVEIFRRHCEKDHLIARGDRLLLAVSGGVDSRVLLDLFAALQAEWELTLAVGHVHHQLRGAQAEADAAFVEKLARDYRLEFLMQKIEVREYAAAHHLSLEAAGRKLRYRALNDMRREADCNAIVTAHTGDDQAETILAHLMRGSGLSGLAGMPSKRVFSQGPAVILRPLLPFSRRQILTYATQQNLHWREDASNADVSLRRNRIRHELLPLLKARFNPGIARSLQRLAKISAEIDHLLRQEAEEALKTLILVQTPAKIVLDLQQFWKYFRPIQAYVVRRVMQQVTSSRCNLTFQETDRILSMLAPAHGHHRTQRYLWRQMVEIAVAQTEVAFSRLRPALPTRMLTIGKRCPVPEAGIAITVVRREQPPNWRDSVTANSQWADAQAVRGHLRVRFPLPGDRFQPLGMTGFKKLSDFLIDLKVPWHERKHIPLLECDNGIIWVCGYRLDERFKIKPTTKEALHMQIEVL